MNSSRSVRIRTSGSSTTTVSIVGGRAPMSSLSAPGLSWFPGLLMQRIPAASIMAAVSSEDPSSTTHTCSRNASMDRRNRSSSPTALCTDTIRANGRNCRCTCDRVNVPMLSTTEVAESCVDEIRTECWRRRYSRTSKSIRSMRKARLARTNRLAFSSPNLIAAPMTSCRPGPERGLSQSAPPMFERIASSARGDGPHRPCRAA